MYYVRKLNSVKNLSILQEIENIKSINADIVGQEVRTNKNTLSLWKCKSLEDVEDTIKAILLSGNKISATQLVFIDESLFKEFNIGLLDSEGKTAYDGFSNLHSDAIVLTYEEIETFLKILKNAVSKDANLLKLEKNDIKQRIKEAVLENKINDSVLNLDLKKDLERYKVLSLQTD